MGLIVHRLGFVAMCLVGVVKAGNLFGSNVTRGNWSECSQSCDGGMQSRDVFCGSQLCGRQQGSCNRRLCDDPYSESEWSVCSVSCGGGVKSRLDKNGKNKQEIRCNTQSCDPILGDCVGDVVLVVDSSSSIGEDKWPVAKQFVVDVVRGLRVSDDQTRLGIVTFSTMATVTLELASYNNADKIVATSSSLPYLAGVTNTADGIMYASQIIQQHQRPGVTSFIVIITDGVSTIDQPRTIPEAEIAKEAGVHVMAIGIGDINKDELRGIVTNSSQDDYLFFADNYDVVQDLTNVITNAICKITNVPVCENCTDFGECIGSCGVDGEKHGHKECWMIDEYTGIEIANSRMHLACSETCIRSCTAVLSPELSTNLPVSVPDCSRCDYTKGLVWQPNAADCHQYFVCEPLPNGRHRVHAMSCGSRYWHQAWHTCVISKPKDAACVDVPLIEVTTSKDVKWHCPYVSYPNHPEKFWIEGFVLSVQTCGEAMLFSADICGCQITATLTRTCESNLLLHFPYDHHYDDVTCHKAKTLQYGENIELIEDPQRGSVVCFGGDTHLEVPFLRTWFAGQEVRNFSISLWFKKKNGSGLVGIVNNYDCIDNASFALSLQGNGVFGSISTESEGQAITEIASVPYGEWVHLGWVYNGAMLRVYVNGTLAEEISINGYMTNPDVPLRIATCCEDHFFEGCMDELMIYNKVLSAEKMLYISQQ